MATKGTAAGSFAGRLKQAAAELKLSQADLARRLGVTRGAVSHWYSGRSIPEGATLAALADVLNVRAQWIASGSGGRAPAAPESLAAAPAADGPDELESALIDAFRAMTPDGRAALASLAVQVATQSGDAEVLDLEVAWAMRSSVASIRRAALEMIRAWLALPEAVRAAHKRRIETDALRYREPAPQQPTTGAAVAKPQQHSSR